jgi:GAF domain-containing protein
VAADQPAGEPAGSGAPAAAPTSPPPLTIVPPPPAHAPTATVAAVQRAATPEPEVPELFLRAELCAAAGLTSSQLTELESYGLLAGRGTGPNATYTQSDLAIANAAAGFMARGIEARHLRTWRQAAERETALFDQRILPLLRQRNPQARQDAVDLLNDLVELGGQLREAIVKAAVRHHVDP